MRYQYGYYSDGRRTVLGECSEREYEGKKKEIDNANYVSKKPGVGGSKAGYNDRWFIEPVTIKNEPA